AAVSHRMRSVLEKEATVNARRFDPVRFARFFTAVALVLAAANAAPLEGQEQVTALVGATLIDGNGGPPVPDVTIVVRGNRIAEIGPRASVRVPDGARVIDAAGRYATPGFIDTNVHISLYNNGESMVRYEDRFTDLVIETA